MPSGKSNTKQHCPGRFGVGTDLLLHPLPLCDRSSTILSIKRRNSARSDSSLFVFVIRKTLNRRSLWFRAPTQSLGDCIAWYGCADDFGLQLAIAVTNRWFT
jgi:hypothetical protein